MLHYNRNAFLYYMWLARPFTCDCDGGKKSVANKIKSQCNILMGLHIDKLIITLIDEIY